MDVPALLTRGTAKQEVPAEQALSCHLPVAHWAKEPETQASWPSALNEHLHNGGMKEVMLSPVQLSDCRNEANCKLSCCAASPFFI